jgi:hypothetical protein
MPYAAAKNFCYPNRGHGSCLSMAWRLVREFEKMGCIIFPFCGENVIKNLSRSRNITNKFQRHVISPQPAGRLLLTKWWGQDEAGRTDMRNQQA